MANSQAPVVLRSPSATNAIAGAAGGIVSVLLGEYDLRSGSIGADRRSKSRSTFWSVVTRPRTNAASLTPKLVNGRSDQSPNANRAEEESISGRFRHLQR